MTYFQLHQALSLTGRTSGLFVLCRPGPAAELSWCRWNERPAHVVGVPPRIPPVMVGSLPTQGAFAPSHVCARQMLHVGDEYPSGGE